MNELLLGLVTGLIFGFLLQKGRVLRFEKQVSALLFEDMTIIKFMLSAVTVGMVGLYLLKDIGFIALDHKSFDLAAVVLGGGLFGAGWAVMGFCPGTSIGAVGEGRWHAVWAVLGMITGAGLFAELYPFLQRTILSRHDLGKISLADITGIGHWPIIAILAALYIVLFVFFEKKKI